MERRTDKRTRYGRGGEDAHERVTDRYRARVAHKARIGVDRHSYQGCPDRLLDRKSPENNQRRHYKKSTPTPTNPANAPMPRP